VGLQGPHIPVDEQVPASELCDAERAEPSAQLSTSSFRRCRRRLSPCQKLQRLLMRSRPDVGIRYREGMLDTSRLRASSIDPMYPLSFKREKDRRSRHDRHAAARQFGFDARASDMVAAMCADIWRARSNACAVKTEISASRRAPGRAVSHAKSDRDGKPPHPGRLNDLAPHHLQGRRRTLATRASRTIGLYDARRFAQGKH